jgi:hypothetical protein
MQELDKWTTNKNFGTVANGYNANMDKIKGAVDNLETNASLLNVRCALKSFGYNPVSVEIYPGREYLIFLTGVGDSGTWMGTLNRHNNQWRLNLLYRTSSFNPTINSSSSPNTLDFSLSAWTHLIILEVK